MKPQIENLGKVSVTVEKEYWSKNNQYDRLTIVHDTTTIASYISRKDVPAGINIDDTEYWIPLGRVSDYLKEFVDDEKVTLSNLAESVSKALEDNREFHDDAYNDIQSLMTSFNETITNTLNTINSNNTTFESNENDRKQAEIKRVNAENTRVTKENERNSAEALRQSAEDERELAEEKRQFKYINEYDTYEYNRRNAETLRNAAESSRQEQEVYRISNEESRQNAESIRQGNENVRNSSETNRQQGEQARVKAENNRVIAENNRVTAESNRQLQEGNDSDEADANGSRWARYKAAENIRQQQFNETQTSNSTQFNESQTNKQEAYETAETERWNSFTEAEARRDKEVEDAVSILDTYETKLNNKANVDGSYSTMTVGAAETLLGSDVVTAKYTYRPTAGTADVADGVAKISSVKGNTIVWNQIAIMDKNTSAKIEQNGNSYIYTPNQISTTPGGVGFSSGWAPISTPLFLHKYYVKFKFTRIEKRNDIEDFTPQDVSVRLVDVFSLRFSCSIGESININHIFTLSSLTSNKLFISLNDCICQIDNIQLFDLTQMFGEGNEPTIEEFEAMFPNDYYEYNEGELRSIEDFSIKSVGFNQCDEEWELGVISADNGENIPQNNYIRTKNHIRLLSNEKYYCNIDDTLYNDSYGLKMYFYDINKVFIKTQTINNVNIPRLFYTPDNAHYGRFTLLSKYGTIYNNDITINLSHSGIRDGEYEPYQEDILPINISTIKDENGEQLFPNGLCSAGEAHDELVYDKGIGKWKAVKRIGSVDMGSLKWLQQQDGENRYVSHMLNSFYKTSGTSNLNNVKYAIQNAILSISQIKVINTIATIGREVGVYDDNYTNVDSFKQSLQGQILYYELAEPIEVVLDDFTSNYKVSDWGTEEILMNSTPIVPVIYDVEYALNAVDTLRNMPSNYISKESLDAFLYALGSAMGGTWTTTYNESNNRYDFTFSANTSTTELIEE